MISIQLFFCIDLTGLLANGVETREAKKYTANANTRGCIESKVGLATVDTEPNKTAASMAEM